MTDPKTPPPLDLSAILAAAPPKRTATIDLAGLDISRFGIGELLELTDAVGVAPDRLGAALKGAKAGRVIVAIAWLIARRVDPALTFADVATWDIEVRGTPPADPTPAGSGRRRRGPSS